MQTGFGREGSQSPIAEGKAERSRQKTALSATMYHMLQREELLGFDENMPINLSNALPPPPLPKQSKQKLRSPKNNTSHMGPVDNSQEIVTTRASVRRSPRKEVLDAVPQEELSIVLAKTSSKGRDKSPHNSRRSKAEISTMEEEQLDIDLKKKPKADDSELKEKSPCQLEKQHSKSGRSTRRSRMELQEITERGDNVVVEALGRATRRGQSRTNTRQHKRKAPDSSLYVVPETMIQEKINVQCPELSRNTSQSRKSRRGVPDGKATRERTNWLQYMTDLVMWSDPPKSALVFGSGSFCVLSSCFTRDFPFSLVTILSYSALSYLAVVFFYKSFIRRGAIDLDTSSTNYELSEADVLRVIRVILPPVNALFAKIKDLFSGDPSTTLKLASVLWLLAQCGHMMTIWTLIRLAFFLIFTIPKLYSCYSAQLHGYGQSLLLRCWEIWNACSHKKAVLFSSAALAWNLSSAAARTSGAFILIVALRIYQKSLTLEPNNPNGAALEEDARCGETNAREITGLELMTRSHAGR